MQLLLPHIIVLKSLLCLVNMSKYYLPNPALKGMHFSIFVDVFTIQKSICEFLKNPLFIGNREKTIMDDKWLWHDQVSLTVLAKLLYETLERELIPNDLWYGKATGKVGCLPQGQQECQPHPPYFKAG